MGEPAPLPEVPEVEDDEGEEPFYQEIEVQPAAEDEAARELKPTQRRPQSYTYLEAIREFEDALPSLPSSPSINATQRAEDDDNPETEIGLDSQSEGRSTNVWEFDKRREANHDANGKPIMGGRYRVEEGLAAGGMARIYKVRHLHLDKEFALKIIHSDLSADAHMRKNFVREAKVLSKLDHKNIVQVVDFGVDPEKGAYIVMEYLRGQTLHTRLEQEHRLRVPLALDVALQLADALHYMHKQNIIHCDIKAENIFLCRQSGEQRRRPIVKLIDFGLSRTEALGAQLARSEVGGTPQYMSPEQIRGQAPQPSMDIYSLGVLLYEMVVGELPFKGTTGEVIAAHLHREAPNPSEALDEELDERVEALIKKALEKDPRNRQQTMGQMIFEIRTLMDMLGLKRDGRRAQAVRREPASVAVVDNSRVVFEHCPCPLFRIDSEPRVLVANPSFCAFVSLSPDEVVGRSLGTTRLGAIFPGLHDEIKRCAAQGMPLQRVLTFERSAGQPVSVVFWLVPEVDDALGITFTGIILPVGQ